MRLKSITTKSGENQQLGSFTVLVGPNNIGKTQSLNDIYSLTTNTDPRTVVIKDREFSGIDSLDDLLEDINVADDPNHSNRKIATGFVSESSNKGKQQFSIEHLQNHFSSGNLENILGTIENLTFFI